MIYSKSLFESFADDEKDGKPPVAPGGKTPRPPSAKKEKSAINKEDLGE